MNQDMQMQKCKTCGTSNMVYDQRCRVCQGLLEAAPTQVPVDNPQPDQPLSQEELQASDQSAKLLRPLEQAAIPVDHQPPVTPPRPERRFRRSRLIIAGLLLLLLATLGGGLLIIPKLSPPPTTTLCLATDLPLTGQDRDSGLQIQHATELAYRQSQFGDNKIYKNHQLKIVHMDDSSPKTGRSDPEVGVKNLQRLFQNAFCANPVAIIGPYNSLVAVKEIPFASQNHTLLLSPANTAPCLTQEAFSDSDNCDYDSIHPQGFSKSTYARLSSTDKDQAYQVARLLTNDPGKGGLGVGNIVIVGDEEIYGTQLSQSVIKELGLKHIKPTGVYCIKPSDDFNKNPSCLQLNSKDNLNAQAFSDDNIKALAVEIQGKHPDAIFFGGLPSRGGSLLRRELGGQIPFVGGSALVSSAQSLFDTIGSDAANLYATFPGVDPSTLTETTFFRQYQKTFGTPPGPRSTDGYDATNIVLQAIKDLIDKEQQVTNESVARAVLDGRFVGVAGKRIQFDLYGDNGGERVLTIYQSQQQEGKWLWHRLREEIM